MTRKVEMTKAFKLGNVIAGRGNYPRKKIVHLAFRAALSLSLGALSLTSCRTDTGSEDNSSLYDVARSNRSGLVANKTYFIWADSLSVRSAPVSDPANVIGSLAKNSKVMLIDARNSASDVFAEVMPLGITMSSPTNKFYVGYKYLGDAILSGGAPPSGGGTLGGFPNDPNMPRPNQYVALAFDGSKSLEAWADTTNFANNFEQSTSRKLKFTYFLSCVYWLNESKKSNYKEPASGVSKSAIGWNSGDATTIRARNAAVNHARNLKNEIGSHACAHFGADQLHYGLNEWDLEFKQFNKIIFGAEAINGFTGPLNFAATDLRGFRAPLLESGKGLNETLVKYGYVYDTSETEKSNYWPQKRDGIWNFPLASLDIVSGMSNGRPTFSGRTLSMDYNFLVAHERRGITGAAAEEEMYLSYMNYFLSNYRGNRAPVNIGHHFANYNGGAYWRAMKRFATEVCKMPEVVCGTYTDLVDFMELNAANISAFKRGAFNRQSMPSGGDKSGITEPNSSTFADPTQMSKAERLLNNLAIPSDSKTHRDE